MSINTDFLDISDFDYSIDSDLDTYKDRVLFRKKVDRLLLSSDEIDQIKFYLENPTKSGLWVLEIGWKDYGGISKEILDRVKKKLARGPRLKVGSKVDLRLEKNEQKEVFANIKKRSFIFALFDLLLQGPEKKEKSYAEYLKYRKYDDYRVIFDQLSLKDLRGRYSEAFEYFKDNIYFTEFDAIVKSAKILKVKSGLYIFSDEDNDRDLDTESNFYFTYTHGRSGAIDEDHVTKVSFSSIDSEPLENLLTFYKQLGLVDYGHLKRVFSPEEEIFKHYMIFLEAVCRNVSVDVAIRERVKRAVAQFNDEEYEYCVSTVGLVAEEILTRIYETFLRKPCPKRLTLGELYALMQNQIRRAINPEAEIKCPDIDCLYKKVDDLLAVQKGNNTVKTLELIRGVVGYIHENSKFTQLTIEKTVQKDRNTILFPKSIKENLEELIANRNAVNHRSAILVGKREALRTTYCFITLIGWWEYTLKQINWKDSTEAILANLIEANNTDY